MIRRFFRTLPRLQSLQRFDETSLLSASLRTSTNGHGPRYYFVSSTQFDRPTSVTSQLLPKPDLTLTAEQLQNKLTEGKGDKDSGIFELQKHVKSISNLDDLQSLLEKVPLEDDAVPIFLDAIANLCKEEKSEVVKKNVLKSFGVQKLCKVLRNRARWMETRTRLTAVKLLVLLGAPASNTTLQILIRLLSKEANSLSLKEISYLHFLLEKTSETPLVSALKLALPVVFESQVSVQMDKDDVQSLADCFCYACTYELSEQSTQLIVDALVTNGDRLTPRQAAVILWQLSDSNHTGLRSLDLLKQSCFRKVTDSMESLSTTEISTTISKLARRVHNVRASIASFYNEDFVEGVCNILIQRKEKVSSLYLAKSVSLMRHVNIEYLDYLADLIVQDPSMVLNNDRLYLSLIRVFSMANYKPESLKVLEHALGEHPALTKDLSFQEITIAADLLALEIFPSSLITRIFSEEFYLRLDNFLKQASPHLLMVVYNAVKYLYPSYQGPLPPISMVERWKNKLHILPKQYQLKAALEAGFGGETYVINGLFHEGFHIDHGIVMRKGGFPMAITDKPRNISELQLPPDSVIVMVKSFLQESYANNTNRMRGISNLELRIIEKFGHPVIPIDVVRWQALQDYEKIPFLMHKVRDVVDQCWSKL